MKILLVNNHTVHLKNLNAALAGYDVEIQTYHPGLIFNEEGKDLIILSGGGGEGLEIYDKHAPGKYWYDDQRKFILQTNKPVIGICMGFEVIASAFGEKVSEIGELIEGFRILPTTKKGKDVLSEKHLRQFEAHRWRVENVSSKTFEVLATSETGIEVIRHQKKPIFATQFHPEKGGTLKLKQLIQTAF